MKPAQEEIADKAVSLVRKHLSESAIARFDKDVERFREDILSAIIELEHLNIQQQHRARATTKGGKLAARRLAQAIRRVEVAAKSNHLDFKVRRFFPTDELIKWRKQCEQWAAFDPDKKRARSASSKLRAAKNALAVMRKYALPVKTTKKGLFCELAKLIYVPRPGERGTDLHHQCRAIQKSAK